MTHIQVSRLQILDAQEEFVDQSECLHEHREQQGQVLSTSDWQFVRGVEVDDLWDGVKGRTVLAQDVLAVFAVGELHVHETLTAPVMDKSENEIRKETK